MRWNLTRRTTGIGPCRTRWLQLACCAVLAWAWWRATPAIYVPPALPPAANAPVAAAIVPAVPAALDLTHLSVVVQARDTLDGIFRRLKIDIADLASMRALPGVRQKLDSLKPGEEL